LFETVDCVPDMIYYLKAAAPLVLDICLI